MQKKFLSLILAICMVISTITPLMAGEITILTPRMGEENTTPKEDKGDIVVLDPILSEPETPKVIDDEKPKEEPKLDVSEENEPLILGAGNSGDFKTEKRADGLYITGLSDTFEGLNITIPKEIDGEPVVGIADEAFLSKKLDITIEKNPNLKYIGNHAFFENNVGALDFTDTTNLVIGNYAFSKNNIMNVHFGSNTEIGEYAFRDNELINLDLTGVSKLGLGSFSNNRIMNLTNINVDLPKYSFINNNLSKIETEHLVDALALTHNHRYVRVLTGNEQNETSKVPNGFGHVVNPVLVRVHFINKEESEEIIPMKIMGDDMSREGEVFILNKENTLKVPQIDGYVPLEKSVTFTPDKDNYDLVLYYKPTDGKPEILYTAPDKPTWPGDVIDEAYLLSLVKATDMLGNDITDKIEVEPKVLDTNPGGEKPVSYTVTDEFGNTQVLNVNIPVSLGWMPVRFDGDWTYGDFTYDGDAVTGLTPEGEKKLDGTRELVIPPKVPDNNVREYENLMDVKRIGNAAFKDKSINNWIKMPDTIEEIGDEAFYRVNIVFREEQAKNLNTDMERELIEVETKYSHGSKEYILNLIKVYKNFAKRAPKFYLPKNLKKIGNRAFLASFGQIELGYYFNDIIIPDTVEEIGKEAFETHSLVSVNIPTELKIVGENAFYNCSLREDVLKVPKGLKHLPGLGIIFDYDDGFSSYYIKSLMYSYNESHINDIIPFDIKKIKIDFSEATELEDMGSSKKNQPLFSNVFVQKHVLYADTIDLSPLKKLKYVGEGFFWGLFVDGDIIIKDMPNLEYIYDQAFYSYAFSLLDTENMLDRMDDLGFRVSIMVYLPLDFDFDKRRALEMVNCPKFNLDVSGTDMYNGQIFFSQFRTDLILKDLPNLTSLSYLLYYELVRNIELKNLPKVTELKYFMQGFNEEYSLFNSKDIIKELDLRGLTNLKDVFGVANDYRLEKVYIPDTVEYISNSFQDEDITTKVFTESGLNPHNLENEYNYIINPGPFKATFVTTEDDKEIQIKEPLVIEEYSSGSVYSIPRIDGYKVTEYFDGERKQAVPEDGEIVVNLNKGGNYKFYYQKLTEKDAPYLKYSAEIQDKKIINETEFGKYVIDLSVLDSPTDSLSGAKIIVEMPEYVNMDTVEVPKSGAIKNIEKKGQNIEITIYDLSKGNTLNIPVLFKFKKYETPKDTDLNLSSYIILDNGYELIKKSNDSSIRYDYKDPEIKTWGISGNAGKIQTVEGKERLTGGKGFGFNFSTLKNLSRNIGDYEIKVKVPKYTKILDDGTEVKEDVTLNEKSTGWVREGDYFVLKEKNTDKLLDVSKSLYVDALNIKNNEYLTFEYEITLNPDKKPDTEKSFVYTGSQNIRAFGTTSIPGTSKIWYSSINIIPDVLIGKDVEKDNYYKFIYNNKEWNKKDVDYKIIYSNLQEGTLKNKTILINQFDDRYKYHTLILPENKTIKTVAVLKSGEEVELKGKEITLPDDLDEIRLEVLEELGPREDIEFTLKSTPIKPVGTENINLHVQETSIAKFKNDTIHSGNYDNSSIKIVPFHHKTGANITHYTDNNTENRNINLFPAGKKVTYEIGLKDVYEENIRELGSENIRIEDLKNFKALVKLPKNFEFEDVVLTDNFKNLDEASYDLIKENGFTYILFKASKLLRNVRDIALISGNTVSEMGDNDIVTPMYVTWDSESTEILNKVTADETVKNLTSETPGLAETTYKMVVVKGISYTLRLKDDVGDKKTTLDTTKNILNYELRMANSLDKTVKNLNLYGFAPTNDKGVKTYISEPVTVPAGYTVYYTTDENPTEKSNYTNTFSENVTGFKVVNPEGLPANEILTIDYKAELKLPAKFKDKVQYEGLEFKSNALRTDEISGNTPLKSNTTIAKFTLPNANVKFIKYGLKKSIFGNDYNKIPLEGAVFEMRDMDGNFIGKATSGKNGLVEFKDIPAKEYIIKELVAPEGYVKGDDIKVTLEDFKETAEGIVADLTRGVINENRILGNLTIKKQVYNKTHTGKPLSGKFKVKGASVENIDIEYEVDVKNGQGTLLNLPEGEYEVEEIDTANKSGAYFGITNKQTFKIEQTTGDTIADKNVEVELLFEASQAYIPLYFVEYPSDKEYPKDITAINNLNEYPVLTTVYDERYRPDANGKGLIEINIRNGFQETLKGFVDVKSPSVYIDSYGREYSPLGKNINLRIDEDLNVYYDNNGTESKFDFNRVIVPVQKKKLVNKISLAVKGADKDNPATIYLAKDGKKEKLTLDTTGSAHKYENNLETGVYEVEAEIPNGFYTLLPMKGTINVNNIYLTSEISGSSSNVLKLTNVDFGNTEITKTYSAKMELNPIEIGLQVINEKNEPIKDAKYELCDTEGKCVALPPADENGAIDMSEATKGMDANKYYSLKNTFAPGEYKKESTDYTFKFMELLEANNFETPIITRTLYPHKGTIIVSKYGDRRNEVIQGQMFGLYKDGKKIAEDTTDDAGLISFKDLDLGDYVVKEEKVTDEFVLNKKEYNVTLNTDQTEVKLEIFNHRWRVVVPKTGTLGIVPYVLIGLLILGCAYVLLVKKKKEDENK